MGASKIDSYVNIKQLNMALLGMLVTLSEMFCGF